MKVNKLFSMGVIATIAIVSLAKATPYKPVSHSVLDNKVIANPIYKVGTPYTIKGISYTPTLDSNYDELGIASWYGVGFNGQLTSNGEIFDKNLVTAASTVLPLPSIVEVTNLDNGKKILVRVNDRGPYASGRIIDLSERAAILLGYKDKGVAKVRVRLLPDLSKKVAEQMSNYNKVMSVQAATNSTVGVVPAVANGAAVAPKSSAPILVSKESTNTQEDSQTKLKQVNYVEPAGIQQYIPKGVFVQIGAFKKNNTIIQENLNSLSKVGVVTLQNVDINGNNILRVRVGPYGSINDASKVKSTLIRLGFRTSRVVIEE